MYKITLFDDNMPSCTSGTVSYYCDDIDRFEEEWIRLEQDESRIERFRRSKAGEMVTDYYCNIPELNIVQKENLPRTFYERDVYIEDETITLRNGYGSETDYYIHKAHIHLRYEREGLDFVLLGKYRIEGICRESWHSEGKYEYASCYGNSILKHNLEDTGVILGDKEDFANDTIESIAYLELKRFKGLKEMYDDNKDRDRVDMTAEELSRLFCDIPGEAG